tara:strand:+ start:439 stop:675 length:237 start_codon:yes stop_codon:yes gene_type:complete
MKHFKVRLFGAGIRGEHILPFNTEPTADQIEDTVALLINEGIMKLTPDTGFHSKNRWTLTYEEVTEEKEKELILGTWV